MNADQKQRAAELISRWNKDYPEFVGDRMANLLQELIDAPEVLAATNPAQISSSAEPVMCPGCEGLPANSNNPCAVCGKKAPAPSVPDGFVHVYVSGLTGSGKSAVAGEIEIALRASGLDVEWVDSESEKHLTHADYTSALELYRPKVRIFEKNISRTAPPAQSAPVKPMENIALNEWLDKTEWVQKELNTFPVSSLGMHRADVMRLEIDRLRKLLSEATTPAEAPADLDAPEFSDGCEKEGFPGGCARMGCCKQLPATANPARDARLQVESEFAAMLPGVTYMDEPDGGSPTVQEQVKRMARDAERYRWLRNPTTDPALVIDKRVGPSFWDYEYRAGDELDAAIDAAIERDKLKGQS